MTEKSMRDATVSDKEKTPSAMIDARIASLDDWRGATLAHVRRIMHAAIPDVVEEWKWRGVPVWSHNGIICTGETYKDAVKLTFAKGAALPDPGHLFNASLEGNTRRAIDIHDGDRVDDRALTALFLSAASLNDNRKAPTRSKRASKTAAPVPRRKASS